MKQAYSEIESLINRNAIHRKGYPINSVTNEFVLNRAGEELQELRESPDDISELGDTIAILLHYAIRKKWTVEQIETAIIDKLKIRFSQE